LQHLISSLIAVFIGTSAVLALYGLPGRFTLMPCADPSNGMRRVSLSASRQRVSSCLP
jgi:hypothetical protein